jgi:hypothetical protein
LLFFVFERFSEKVLAEKKLMTDWPPFLFLFAVVVFKK